ncbi:serine dehydratase subunit alpha family protein [Thermohalobacter berrensis]|uniref:UPF0597 protein BET03_00490 n=1 Tax=Thermohalobacter berrensis TaxID=99594 RepID=A0A419TA55_9FIRM|nr:L-serine ammonia-lyase, iron-sulfur-dependent, subunit alpha [Thermohalobacter berrensis]RKD34345.1 hypothetical protein BET03_00490 [Thermohalobacter berrensis]
MGWNDFEKIISLLKKELVPALGCTEPIAVALATSKAREVLKEEPDKIEVLVSRNILKNGMAVGIPGTGMTGLKIAAALGAIGGNSQAKLEVLKYINNQHIERSKEIVKENKVSIKLKDTNEKLYIEAICSTKDNISRVIIKGNHSNIVEVRLNNDLLLKKDSKKAEVALDKNNTVDLNVKKIFKFANTEKIENIEFLLDGAKMNKAISKEGLKGNYGLMVGKKIAEKVKRGILSDDIMTYAMSVTAAASDARMDGCMYPVMSNSGSGNQGLTVMLPVVAVAEKLNVDREKLIRALALSNLMTIYIKTYLGRLSALCGVVVASIGSSCGITYLLGGKYHNIVATIKNMIGDIAGMICDGAKPGCALKVSTGVSAAIKSALLAIDGIEISEYDGIIEKDVDKTIKKIGEIGSKGMHKTDKYILDIMVNK